MSKNAHMCEYVCVSECTTVHVYAVLICITIYSTQNWSSIKF